MPLVPSVPPVPNPTCPPTHGYQHPTLCRLSYCQTMPLVPSCHLPMPPVLILCMERLYLSNTYFPCRAEAQVKAGPEGQLQLHFEKSIADYEDEEEWRYPQKCVLSGLLLKALRLSCVHTPANIQYIYMRWQILAGDQCY